MDRGGFFSSIFLFIPTMQPPCRSGPSLARSTPPHQSLSHSWLSSCGLAANHSALRRRPTDSIRAAPVAQTSASILIFPLSSPCSLRPLRLCV